MPREDFKRAALDDVEERPEIAHHAGTGHSFVTAAAGAPYAANGTPSGADIFHELAQRGFGSSREEVMARLAEKVLLQDEMVRRRAMKGAIGQKAAADERREKWEALARQLIVDRRFPFPSYRALACAVARSADMPGTEETIRKHLANSRCLNVENRG